MLGEETVLLKALEGKRGQPEQRPPHPADARPLRPARPSSRTSQTLAAVPWILANGAEAFAAIGSKAQPGHDPRLRSAAPARRRRRRGPDRDAAQARSSAWRRHGARPQAQGDPRRRPIGRHPAADRARHALRVRGAPGGRRPRRLGLDRRRRRARLHRRPGPPPDPLLRRRGLRQDDPLPDRDCAASPRSATASRRASRSPPTSTCWPTCRPTSSGRPCATTSGWRPSRSRAGCDTSAPSSTSTSCGARARPASAARSRSPRGAAAH